MPYRARTKRHHAPGCPPGLDAKLRMADSLRQDLTEKSPKTAPNHNRTTPAQANCLRAPRF